ncbi:MULTISPECIES: ORF6C domain-containing protein [Latilactobacillus]|uniref:ORF6C domain-containing protein n=1 Tax=Latilactobacillus TaxID=2767885 RepID=UPI00241080A9|nr:ORF6C domain-containing protein [Latilactobacillus curvatus]MDG2976890.1 ORF6C domain-containing protein [Latilactobacillus curvatus]
MTENSLVISPNMTPDQQQVLLIEGYNVLVKKVKRLEDEYPIMPRQNQQLNRFRLFRIIDVLGGKDSNAYKNKHVRAKVQRAFAKDYKEFFEVDIYANTPRGSYKKALGFISDWLPSFEVGAEIRELNKKEI